MAPLVPQLWDLHGAHLLRLRKAEEELIHADAGFEEVLGQDRGLGELAEVVDHGLALGDQVKVVGELLRILHQRVVRPGDARVLKAVGCHFLLPRLHAHLHKGDEDAVLRHLDLRLSHDEPLARLPLIGAADIREVKATLHPHDGLGLLAHRKLLQVVVRLEHDLADAGALQPLGLETLDLPQVLDVARLAGGRAGQVQREERLAALRCTDTESERKVLEVDRGRRVERGEEAELGSLQHQAAHALRDLLALQEARKVHIARDELLLPADVVLGPLHLLQIGIAALASLLIGLGLAQHDLCLALAMHEGRLAARCISEVADGEAALGAQLQLLAV
mmetsp:Transcript_73440/g.195136  ORF Transcript_73440/g.195136 Transcript_73440/m.195136 type:complete len:335 (+) Transcript_73440:1530-2534(+)